MRQYQNKAIMNHLNKTMVIPLLSIPQSKSLRTSGHAADLFCKSIITCLEDSYDRPVTVYDIYFVTGIDLVKVVMQKASMAIRHK